jgi:carbamoyl-phosphate synthase large subunit
LTEIFRSSSLCGVIAAADNDPRATIQYYVDRFVQTPSITEEEAYVATLLDQCGELGIHCILPQNDLDLVVLAANRARFESAGVRVLGVPLHVAAAMADKLESSQWLQRHNLPSPRTDLYTGPPFDLPAVAKSRFGQGSQGLQICRTPADLGLVPEGTVIQEMLDGKEYNLDILRDGFGTVVSVVVKEKLCMHHGSTDKAVSVRDDTLEVLGTRLGHALELVGSADVDVFVTDRGPLVIDVNPRVGGGFPFTAEVCPEYVDALLAIALNRAPEPVASYPEGIEIHRELRYRPVPNS